MAYCQWPAARHPLLMVALIASTSQAQKWKTCGTRGTSSSPNPFWVAVSSSEAEGTSLGTNPGPWATWWIDGWRDGFWCAKVLIHQHFRWSKTWIRRGFSSWVMAWNWWEGSSPVDDEQFMAPMVYVKPWSGELMLATSQESTATYYGDDDHPSLLEICYGCFLELEQPSMSAVIDLWPPRVAACLSRKK